MFLNLVLIVLLIAAPALLVAWYHDRKYSLNGGPYWIFFWICFGIWALTAFACGGKKQRRRR
jgi:hypothetical protein